MPHCIRGTKGWELIPEIGEMAKKAGSLIFDKPTFGSMALAGCLNGIHKVAKIDGFANCRSLHGYLCCIECFAFKGDNAGC